MQQRPKSTGRKTRREKRANLRFSEVEYKQVRLRMDERGETEISAYLRGLARDDYQRAHGVGVK